MPTTITPRTPDYVTLHFGGDGEPAMTVIKVAEAHAIGVVWGDVGRLERQGVASHDADCDCPEGIKVLSVAPGCYIDEDGQIVCYPS